MNGRLGMSQQYALAAEKANCILDCISRIAVSRSREVILLFCSTLEKTHLKY